MNPIKPQRLMVPPPTLEKRLDVLRAIETLAARDTDERQRRRTVADETATALEKLGRDCEALDQAWREMRAERGARPTTHREWVKDLIAALLRYPKHTNVKQGQSNEALFAA